MRISRKGMEMSFNTLISMILVAIVVLFFMFYSSSLGTKTEDGIGSVTDLQCEISPELCDTSNTISEKISCSFDRDSLGPLMFDLSKYDLELKGDYQVKFKSKLGDPLFNDIENLANELGMQPEFLFAVINFETGGSFSSSEENQYTKATGLIQFMPNTAKSLGTSIEDLKKMDEQEQLKYVEKYFKQFNGRNYNSLDRVYMDVLYPAAYGEDLDYVLFTNKIEECKKIYEDNPMDDDNDGYVIVAEAIQRVVNKYNSY